MIDIEKNKNEFIKLLRDTNRQGIEKLIKYIEESDFFIAPASTSYHSAYEGGLCQHSLNVYNRLQDLVRIEKEKGNKLPEFESIVLVSLLHDLDKMNKYESYDKNVNDPSHPEANSQGWYKQKTYKVKDSKNRFVFGTHGLNSMVLAESFISLQTEESIAILHHMGGKEAGMPTNDVTITEIYNKYPLAVMLHVADLMATFIDESLCKE